MINGVDMSKVSKITYNVDSLRETFKFSITYKNGEIVERSIPLYIMDPKTNKKVVNSEATDIANFVTESSKKVQNNSGQPKVKEEKVSFVVEKLVEGLQKAGSYLKLSDFKEFLPEHTYSELYEFYRKKITDHAHRINKNQIHSEEEVADFINDSLANVDIVIRLDENGKFELTDIYHSLHVPISFAGVKPLTLAPVVERVMQKHLDYGKFHDGVYLKASEIPTFLQENINQVRKAQGKPIIASSKVEKLDEPKMETPAKKESVVSQPFSESKLETLNNILKGRVRAELTEEELQSELQKLSREFDVSSKSMEVLYQKAELEVQKEDISELARKKLNGRKIPTKFQTKNNVKIAVTDLNSPVAYNRKGYIERSQDLVIPEFKEEWIEYINKNYREPVPIYGAVDLMVMINNGTSIREIHKYLDNIHNSSYNARAAIELLEKYSPYGKELAKKCRKYTMTRPERLRNFVLEKTSLFVEKVDEKSSNQAIEELKALKASLKEMSEIEITRLSEENNKTM